MLDVSSNQVALLLSGGLDSIALAFAIRPRLAVTVDYGQIPAEAEIQASQSVCKALMIRHEIVHIDCRALGAGDLAGSQPSAVAKPEVAKEWWPYRNQLLATLAAPIALRYPVHAIAFGTVKTDTEHVDGTPGFIESIDRLFAMQEGNLRIIAPAINLTTQELITACEVPQSIAGWAHSCHTGNLPCGKCRGCFKHFSVLSSLSWI